MASTLASSVEVTSGGQAAIPGEHFSADRPIASANEDQFGRAPFAERIATTLASRHDPSSLVVGIYGPWGDGKTSTLHLMEVEALLREAIDTMLAGDVDTGRAILRDYINATVGFEKLGIDT